MSYNEIQEIQEKFERTSQKLDELQKEIEKLNKEKESIPELNNRFKPWIKTPRIISNRFDSMKKKESNKRIIDRNKYTEEEIKRANTRDRIRQGNSVPGPGSYNPSINAITDRSTTLYSHDRTTLSFYEKLSKGTNNSTNTHITSDQFNVIKPRIVSTFILEETKNEFLEKRKEEDKLLEYRRKLAYPKQTLESNSSLYSLNAVRTLSFAPPVYFQERLPKEQTMDKFKELNIEKAYQSIERSSKLGTFPRAKRINIPKDIKIKRQDKKPKTILLIKPIKKQKIMKNTENTEKKQKISNFTLDFVKECANKNSIKNTQCLLPEIECSLMKIEDINTNIPRIIKDFLNELIQLIEIQIEVDLEIQAGSKLIKSELERFALEEEPVSATFAENLRNEKTMINIENHSNNIGTLKSAQSTEELIKSIDALIYGSNKKIKNQNNIQPANTLDINNSAERTSLVGPGTYDSQLHTISYQVKRKQKNKGVPTPVQKRFSRGKKKIPGPGFYNTEKADILVHKSNSNQCFSKSSRFNITKIQDEIPKIAESKGCNRRSLSKSRSNQKEAHLKTRSGLAKSRDRDDDSTSCDQSDDSKKLTKRRNYSRRTFKESKDEVYSSDDSTCSETYFPQSKHTSMIKVTHEKKRSKRKWVPQQRKTKKAHYPPNKWTGFPSISYRLVEKNLGSGVLSWKPPDRKILKNKLAVIHARIKSKMRYKSNDWLSNQLQLDWNSDDSNIDMNNANRRKIRRRKIQSFKYIPEELKNKSKRITQKKQEDYERSRRDFPQVDWNDLFWNQTSNPVPLMSREPGREKVRIPNKNIKRIESFIQTIHPTSWIGPGKYNTEIKQQVKGIVPYEKILGRKEIVGPHGERPKEAIELELETNGPDYNEKLMLNVDENKLLGPLHGGYTFRKYDESISGPIQEEIDYEMLSPNYLGFGTQPIEGHRFLRFNKQIGRDENEKQYEQLEQAMEELSLNANHDFIEPRVHGFSFDHMSGRTSPRKFYANKIKNDEDRDEIGILEGDALDIVPKYDLGWNSTRHVIDMKNTLDRWESIENVVKQMNEQEQCDTTTVSDKILSRYKRLDTSIINMEKQLPRWKKSTKQQLQDPEHELDSDYYNQDLNLSKRNRIITGVSMNMQRGRDEYD